jgi:hypothetical protein
LTTPTEQRRAARLALQAVVFILGLAAMGWAISMALKNREQLANLSNASAGQIAALLALSLATQTINGVLFWLTLRPARHVPLPGMLATNAVATALAYLPFKIGAIARVLIHNRRDRIPIVQIGAWFAAFAVTMLLAFAPPVLAALWLKRIDLAWFGATLIGEAVLVAALLTVSYRLKGARGIERLVRLCTILRLKPALKLLRSRLWQHLHSAFDMLAHPVTTSASFALRLTDAIVQGLRFMVAAQILGVEAGFAPSLVISLAYFVVGVVSPVMVGARELGALGIAALMLPGAVELDGGANSPYATVPLFVTATEAVVYLAVGTLGMLYLRPDKLLRISRAVTPEPADLG